MQEKNLIKIFDNKNIRTIWDSEKEEYFFSVVDICGALSESNIPRNYWSDLKRKLKQEGSELHEKIVQLKMQSTDGKFYNTDTLDTEGVFRLIQSIPSPKSEPFKLWLAKLGRERIDETFDPEQAISRAINTYRKKGYSQKWIENRLKTITNRNELTESWNEHGIEEDLEFAILTNEIYKTWSDLTAKKYKKLKKLTKESLRDNMTNTELALNNLAEVVTKDLIDTKQPYGLKENKKNVNEGGQVAKNARLDAEKRLGKPIVTSKNAKEMNLIGK